MIKVIYGLGFVLYAAGHKGNVLRHPSLWQDPAPIFDGHHSCKHGCNAATFWCSFWTGRYGGCLSLHLCVLQIMLTVIHDNMAGAEVPKMQNRNKARKCSIWHAKGGHGQPLLTRWKWADAEHGGFGICFPAIGRNGLAGMLEFVMLTHMCLGCR